MLQDTDDVDAELEKLAAAVAGDVPGDAQHVRNFFNCPDPRTR